MRCVNLQGTKFIHTNRLIILYVYIKGHKIRQNSLFYIVKEI